ncbi:MAG TPA: baseplate J/gp47 family protein [Steroidobacteraceae bacterium]|jgi:hypothetical protein|nr:baseplate J/gp47 family protein [Steroidobacteraceae bacterium]
MAEQFATIFVPSGSAELRDQWLQDARLAAIDTGVAEPPIEPGTDWYIKAEADAQLGLVALANIAIHGKSTNVLTAVGDDLDAIREGDGLPVVQPAGSTGKIKITVFGATTIATGTQAKLPNGLRIRTVGTVVNPADQQEIDVEAIDVGTLTNLKGGEAVQFVSAPTNVAKAAKVSNAFPLTGGTDAENDARKRARILNTRRNKPAGGNWAYWRQFVQDRFASISDTYVYAAPGGPSSQLIVPVRAFDRSANDYSRSPSTTLIQKIRNTIQSDATTGVETVVRASADELVDFTLLIEIPASTLSGGNGQGWTNQSVWPTLEVADANKVTVSGSPSDYSQITVTANTATAPSNGQTEIAWWSPADRMFYTGLVISHTGSAGAWALTLDRPLVGKNGVGVANGDFICPNAQNLTAYGESWVALLESLGPGEILENDPDRLPRALRNPNASDEAPSSITKATLKGFTNKHPEVTDIDFGYAPTATPTVPASVDDPPNILVPRHFAVYPQ